MDKDAHLIFEAMQQARSAKEENAEDPEGGGLTSIQRAIINKLKDRGYSISEISNQSEQDEYPTVYMRNKSSSFMHNIVEISPMGLINGEHYQDYFTKDREAADAEDTDDENIRQAKLHGYAFRKSKPNDAKHDVHGYAVDEDAEDHDISDADKAATHAQLTTEEIIHLTQHLQKILPQSKAPYHIIEKYLDTALTALQRIDSYVSRRSGAEDEEQGDLMKHMKSKGMIDKDAGTEPGCDCKGNEYGRHREEEEYTIPTWEQYVHKLESKSVEELMTDLKDAHEGVATSEPGSYARSIMSLSVYTLSDILHNKGVSPEKTRRPVAAEQGENNKMSSKSSEQREIERWERNNNKWSHMKKSWAEWKKNNPQKAAAHAAAKAKTFGHSSEQEERRLDPTCWKGYHKAGTKMKGGKRVNNCKKNS